ncbi:BMFP domain-containing protein YqiC [Bradyrhizobium sp. JR7.2]
MTQTNNRFFDEIGRLMNDAAGAAQGVKREFDTVMRTQAEKFLRDMDLVKREEFEAVKDMARLAREENEALKVRITRGVLAGGGARGRRAIYLPPPGGGGAARGAGGGGGATVYPRRTVPVGRDHPTPSHISLRSM